jgi:hypothetical protein
MFEVPLFATPIACSQPSNLAWAYVEFITWKLNFLFSFVHGDLFND